MSTQTIPAAATITSKASPSRIPALDGWRGIAILLVLLDHFHVALTNDVSHSWFSTGTHGVTIFFVLSGFLITSKLIEGPIDLKRFYLRRFFRLMPAAWTYLAFLLLLTAVTGKAFTSIPEIRACVLFYRNFANVPGYGLAGHFWSLSVEEQFYIVWPFILLLTGIRYARWFAAAGAVSIACFRYFSWAHYDQFGTAFQTQARADALLVGCLLALLLAEPRVRSFAQRWSMLWATPALATLIFCIGRYSLPPLFESIAIAALIASTLLHPLSTLSRVLSVASLAWPGIVSYSIYIWQELFVHLGRSPQQHFLLLCVALPAFVLASYYCIERPCTRFGHRLTSRRRLLRSTIAIPQEIQPT